jgi:hypothetical protein
MNYCVIILALSTLSLCGGCTYTKSTRGLECGMKHHWKGKELYVEAHLTNLSHRPVTVIRNPNFSNVWINPKDDRKRSNDTTPTVSWSKSSRESLVTLWHGDSVECSRGVWTVRRIGDGKWRITEYEDEGFDSSDPVLRASFTHSWHPSYLPWRTRLGKLNIFRGSYNSSTLIPLD